MGGGGHTEQILIHSGPDGRVLGLDLDDEALAAVGQRLTGFGDRLMVRQANFASAGAILSEIGWPPVDGIVLDLGISSRLESRERGFSFRGGARLDMRMDRHQALDAYQIVNVFSVSELERILRKYGEEPQARRLALAIESERKMKAIKTTEELAEMSHELRARWTGSSSGDSNLSSCENRGQPRVRKCGSVLREGLRTASAEGSDGGYFVSFVGRSTGENRISQVEP